ncbi:MAG: M23 family metallopeptidase [Clostridia bacterium]|nr:M23 family metallopeptidase [Clostridia bacterium]
MDIRTATQMEKARRSAIAISTLLVVLMLGITTTFIAMSFIKRGNHNSPVEDSNLVSGPSIPTVTASWVMPVNAAGVTILKAADFDMPQYNNTTKWYEFDLGYTLGADAGTSVVACYDGTVTSVVESGDASTGKLIRIKHADNVETVYSSLDEINVAVGDKVKSGDKIGTVGTSGNYEVFDMPHVRLMAYKNGKPVNPENFVEFPGNENK